MSENPLLRGKQPGNPLLQPIERSEDYNVYESMILAKARTFDDYGDGCKVVYIDTPLGDDVKEVGPCEGKEIDMLKVFFGPTGSPWDDEEVDDEEVDDDETENNE